MTNFIDYVKYYDAFYSDKNYVEEANYIAKLIFKYATAPTQILEMGCGTGKHALQLVNLGFAVEAIDLSEEMIRIAKNNLQVSNLLFHHGDARSYKCKNNVDVIVSLFHVFSYMTSDHDIAQFFDNSYGNLKPGGLLIFDYWYSPAVHAIGPSQRVRKYEDDNSIIYRISDPKINTHQSRVDVKIEIVDVDKSTSTAKLVTENHPMRHFSLNEIAARSADKFEILENNEWLKLTNADEKSWGAVCILKKR